MPLEVSSAQSQKGNRNRNGKNSDERPQTAQVLPRPSFALQSEGIGILMQRVSNLQPISCREVLLLAILLFICLSR